MYVKKDIVIITLIVLIFVFAITVVFPCNNFNDGFTNKNDYLGNVFVSKNNKEFKETKKEQIKFDDIYDNKTGDEIEIIIENHNPVENYAIEVQNDEDNNEILSENKVSRSKDEIILDYFNTAKEKIDNMDLSKIKTEGKNIFVTIVDFIFYDTEIKGIKYNDLLNSTKEEVVEIANYIDNKIEEKFPNYKETIKDYSGKTYTYVGEKLKGAVSYVDGYITEKVDEEKYNQAKDDFKESAGNFKDGLKETWDITKDVISDKKSKIKTWYEGIR